jgi:hypothetical protein
MTRRMRLRLARRIQAAQKAGRQAHKQALELEVKANRWAVAGKTLGLVR